MMECLILLAMTLLVASVDSTCTPVSPSHGLLVTADNIRSHASFIHSSATIGGRVIRFGVGTTFEKLVEIPLVPAGQFKSQASVRITVGLDPTAANAGTNSDPLIGIGDGINFNANEFFIADLRKISEGNPPCYPRRGAHQNIGLSTHRVPGLVTFLFDPFHRYGACSTGNDGGYTNVATFDTQLDPSNGINFTIRRNSAFEQYRFYYFLFEILE